MAPQITVKNAAELRAILNGYCDREMGLRSEQNPYTLPSLRRCWAWGFASAARIANRTSRINIKN